MAGEMVCPRCNSVVVPLVDPQGGLHCPACQDTGVIRSAPPGWEQPPPGTPGAAPAPAATADGALATLVLGILALAIPYVGFVLGIIALVFAKRTNATIAASGGRLQGAGMVKAGWILAIIGIVFWGVAVVIMVAAMGFVLVSNVGEGPGDYGPNFAFNRDDEGPGGTLTVVYAGESGESTDWSELDVTGSSDCAAPFGRVEPGDVITCRAAGSVEIVHLPTNTLIYASQFDD